MLTIYADFTDNFGKELLIIYLFLVMTVFVLILFACAGVVIIGTLLYIIFSNMISLVKPPKKYKNYG